MTWSLAQRESVKARLQEIGAILWNPDAINLERSVRKGLKQEERNLLLEYAENLEHSQISRCPLCNQNVQVAMDLGGLHGPWWWKRCPVELPGDLACEHYLFYQGAINFGGRIPAEVTETVLAGPAAPFVIDRVLEISGVQGSPQRGYRNGGSNIFDHLFLRKCLAATCRNINSGCVKNYLYRTKTVISRSQRLFSIHGILTWSHG